MTDEEAHSELAALVESCGGPTADGAPVFDTPAQARAFGLVVALFREDAFEWSAFQRQLIDSIGADDGSLERDVEAAYYDHWQSAIERLLSETGAITPEELEERAYEFARGERDASEFVVDGRET